MIHAVCDFCGKDAHRCASLLTITPFQNFARYHTDTTPFGTTADSRSFVICYDCSKKHKLPNPYESYSGITDQDLTYDKNLNNYTDVDHLDDDDRDKSKNGDDKDVHSV